MLYCQFCNKECKNSNSHKNHERCCPDNSNRVYKNGMLGKKGSNQWINNPDLIMPIETRLKISKSRKGRKTSDETKLKLSIARSEWMKNNSDKTRRKKSYMETSFSKWLIDKNLSFKEEVHFRNTEIDKNYFVDFLFEEKKLIIELDGNQHEKRKHHDAIRDKFLESLGYRILRITHKEYTEKSKFHVVEELLGC